jgi:uncharacterized membrane protein
MNPVDIHLALNHVPVLLVPVGLALLAWGWWRGSSDLFRAGLVLVVLSALASVPVYYSGGFAEEIVEEVPGVSHRAVHAHEEAAEWAFILLLASGAVALLAVFLDRGARRRRWPAALVLVAGLLTVAATWRTARLGGLVRHPEINAAAPAAEH